MKIGICASDHTPESLVANRFARAPYFAVYNSETLDFAFFNNTAKDEGSGAGGKAVKVLGDLKVDIVLVPELGPKAIDALNAFEIKSYQYKQGKTVREALYEYFEKKLPEMLDASVKGKH
ncbi:MAG: Dinitrogenase iron-molybdenum cofactor [Candidatus Izimaplasma bacterium HR2]|nr:MAG: Dinitrogenase iron-molybdenum cofactor [Candidatus Izimaplasma bacterium HR2]